MASKKQYTLTVHNHSQNAGRVVVFQKYPNSPTNYTHVAWMVKPVYPGSNTVIKWEPKMNFLWAPVSSLDPGTTIYPSQIVEADPKADNQIMLDFDATHNVFMFKHHTKGNPGELMTMVSANVPRKAVAVGIGMAGRATFVGIARSNVDMIFIPDVEYWIAFGHFNPAEIIDPEVLKNAAKVKFSKKALSMDATLNPNGSWTIQEDHSESQSKEKSGDNSGDLFSNP